MTVGQFVDFCGKYGENGNTYVFYRAVYYLSHSVKKMLTSAALINLISIDVK